MYYPSFYTTPLYYSFDSTATAPPPDFNKIIKSLPVAEAGNKVQQGNFQRTPPAAPPPNPNDQPVTGVAKQWFDNFTKALTTPSANNPEIHGVGQTVINQTIDFFQCKTFGLSPELCKYAPYILLGVGALILYAVLKYVI